MLCFLKGQFTFYIIECIIHCWCLFYGLLNGLVIQFRRYLIWHQAANGLGCALLKIVIVGAGEVGYNVSRDLSAEGHDITIVELDETRAGKVESELDVRVVRGNGSRPHVLEKAGICEGCNVDVLVASTEKDEVNIMACWIAKRAGVPRVISRARGMEFTDSPTWARELGIDVMSSPERSVARQIEELLQVRSAIHTSELFEGQAGIYAFRVGKGSPLVDVPLKKAREKYPDLKSIFVYVEREKKGFIPNGETVLREEDVVFLVSLREHIWQLEGLFQRSRSRSLKRVIIVGGGKIGSRLAMLLEKRFKNLVVKLIDRDKEKCERLASELERTIVLCSDGTDEDLLRYEGIEDCDGFVTTTTSDEANILMGVIAKAMGARKSIAVVRRKIYNSLSDYLAVDALVNPNEALASVIMKHIRYPYRTGALSVIDKIGADTLEVEIPADSPVLGKKVRNIGFPKGVILALVARGNDVFVPFGNTVLHEGDRVLLFASSRILPKAVEILGV